MPAASARLLLSCADRPGIVSAVSGFLAQQGANIFQSDQYSTDPEGGTFFMRVEFHLEGIDENRDGFEAGFASVAGDIGMQWRLSYTAQRKRLAIMASRHDHCLLDLLWRWRRGELDCDIALVVSNHPDLERDVTAFDVPYVHVPVEKGRKEEAEARMLGLFGERFDLIVLARYMQILSGGFLESLKTPVINIHHSFLPAFAGADPYARARERGVKLIGATAHYVTEELDAGPIIEQDVARVSHRDGVATLIGMGRDIERVVLARAVRSHLDDRVLVDGARTIVF
ncbi:MAG: formyltetrahydrofolate deformylase [Thermoleophilaceae bacterium]